MTETHIFATPLPVITRSLFRIEVSARSYFENSQSYPLTRLYFLEGALSVSEILKLGQALLTDPVTETFAASVVDATGHVLGTGQNISQIADYIQKKVQMGELKVATVAGAFEELGHESDDDTIHQGINENLLSLLNSFIRTGPSVHSPGGFFLTYGGSL